MKRILTIFLVTIISVATLISPSVAIEQTVFHRVSSSGQFIALIGSSGYDPRQFEQRLDTRNVQDKLPFDHRRLLLREVVYRPMFKLTPLLVTHEKGTRTVYAGICLNRYFLIGTIAGRSRDAVNNPWLFSFCIPMDLQPQIDGLFHAQFTPQSLVQLRQLHQRVIRLSTGQAGSVSLEHVLGTQAWR